MTTAPFSVLIVDDEPIACNILEQHLQKMEGFTIAGQCKNVLEAFSVLNKQKVDIMLLDINLPEISGVDFLKTLKNPPLVIFTTAYSEYALQSYDLDAVDFLLKPISFARFMKAMNKATAILNPQVNPPAESSFRNAEQEVMFVRSGGKWIRIDLMKLWFVEGLKDYIRLWTDEGRVTVHSTMGNFEEQLLPYKRFVRVHKSYIVNMDYILELDGNSIKIKDQLIGIGHTYRHQVQKVFDAYKFL